MSFFISDALAQASTATQANDSLFSLMMVGVFVALMYFMMIRPQQQRLKAQQSLIQSLKEGDEVMISGGILGQIVKLDDQYMKLKLTEQCEIHVQKQSVVSILPRGTLKAL